MNENIVELVRINRRRALRQLAVELAVRAGFDRPWAIQCVAEASDEDVSNFVQGKDDTLPEPALIVENNPHTPPRFQDWAKTYTTVSKAELLAKWRQAVRNTVFTPPLPEPDPK